MHRTKLRGLALAFLLSPATGFPATEAQQLLDRHGCMSCHGLLHKQVGPGFAQVAERYAGRPGAAEFLAGRIRNGAVGNWGRLVMPRQSRVSDAEALLLARWVLAQPGR